MRNEQQKRSNRRQWAGSLFWGVISILFGWTLFAYWWAEVLGQDQPRSVFTLLFVVVVFAVVVLAATFFWIWHNRRIAARGNRGRASRYTVAEYEKDALGRRIDLPAQDVMREASAIRIESTPTEKIYRTEEGNAA